MLYKQYLIAGPSSVFSFSFPMTCSKAVKSLVEHHFRDSTEQSAFGKSKRQQCISKEFHVAPTVWIEVSPINLMAGQSQFPNLHAELLTEVHCGLKNSHVRSAPRHHYRTYGFQSQENVLSCLLICNIQLCDRMSVLDLERPIKVPCPSDLARAHKVPDLFKYTIHTQGVLAHSKSP